jgi:hypothetical protein
MVSRPADVVDRQIAAYNAHNLSAFVACYAEDIQIFRPPDREPAITGRAALADFYRTRRFHLPQLQAEVVNRMVLGNKVIDHEHIRGLESGSIVEAIAVYEVCDGLIRRVWFHYPQ